MRDETALAMMTLEHLGVRLVGGTTKLHFAGAGPAELGLIETVRDEEVEANCNVLWEATVARLEGLYPARLVRAAHADRAPDLTQAMTRSIQDGDTQAFEESLAELKRWISQ